MADQLEGMMKKIRIRMQTLRTSVPNKVILPGFLFQLRFIVVVKVVVEACMLG